MTNTLLQKTQKGATQVVSPLLGIGFVLGSFWVRIFKSVSRIQYPVSSAEFGAFAGMTTTLLPKTQKGATQIVSPLLEIGFVLGSFWVRFFWLVLGQFVVSPLCYRVNDVE